MAEVYTDPLGTGVPYSAVVEGIRERQGVEAARRYIREILPPSKKELGRISDVETLTQMPAAAVLSYGNITKTAASDFTKQSGLPGVPQSVGGLSGVSINPYRSSRAIVSSVKRRSKADENRTRRTNKSSFKQSKPGSSSGKASVPGKSAKAKKGVVPPQLKAFLFKKGNKARKK